MNLDDIKAEVEALLIQEAAKIYLAGCMHTRDAISKALMGTGIIAEQLKIPGAQEVLNLLGKAIGEFPVSTPDEIQAACRDQMEFARRKN